MCYSWDNDLANESITNRRCTKHLQSGMSSIVLKRIEPSPYRWYIGFVSGKLIS